MPYHIVSIVGARPQFVKAAVLSRALAAQGFRETMIHTGQHHDENMSAVFFEQLDIPAPKYNLAVAGGGHGAMTGLMLQKIEEVLVAERPDAVVVYGDTNSTLAGAVAAVKLHIPLIHVEAGLRSFNRAMPEEINRVAADHVSDLLLCPTDTALANLQHEGLAEKARVTGDVMYDATLYANAHGAKLSDVVERLGLEKGAYCVLTIHRAENTGDGSRFDSIISFVADQAAGRKVVLPVHPRIRALGEELMKRPEFVVTPPLAYFDMQRLVAESALVMTDSGGLQKEAYFHRIPCITLRDETEWVETIEAGWNRLWTQPAFKSPRHDIAVYGDGDAGEVSSRAITEFLDRRASPLAGMSNAELSATV